MKTSTLNIQVIEPSKKENWLTNGETFSQKVYLGVNDSIDNWNEITNREKEDIIAKQLEDIEKAKLSFQQEDK